MYTEEQKRKAKRQAEAKYRNRVYDRLAIRVPKGRRDVYKALAEVRGESLAGMIINVLDQMAVIAGLLEEDDIKAFQDAETEEDTETEE